MAAWCWGAALLRCGLRPSGFSAVLTLPPPRDRDTCMRLRSPTAARSPGLRGSGSTCLLCAARRLNPLGSEEGCSRSRLPAPRPNRLALHAGLRSAATSPLASEGSQVAATAKSSTVGADGDGEWMEDWRWGWGLWNFRLGFSLAKRAQWA